MQQLADSIHAFDLHTLIAVQSIGQSWYPVAWTLSAIIGSLWILIPVAVGALLIIGKKRVALEVLIISVVSALFIFGLKAIIALPRPTLADGILFQYDVGHDFGMPSAHAFLAVIVFGWLWFRHPKSLTLSIGAGAIIFLVGLSRVYLGVHYPSQVVVGWLLGFVCLYIFHLIDRRLWSPFQKKLL